MGRYLRPSALTKVVAQPPDMVNYGNMIAFGPTAVGFETGNGSVLNSCPEKRNPKAAPTVEAGNNSETNRAICATEGIENDEGGGTTLPSRSLSVSVIGLRFTENLAVSFPSVSFRDEL